MASWSESDSAVIPLNSGSLYKDTYYLSWKHDIDIAGQDNTKKRFRLWQIPPSTEAWHGSTAHGIEFRWDSTNNVTIIDVNATFASAQTSNPFYVNVNSSSASTSGTANITSSTDHVRLWDNQNTMIADFTVGDFMFSSAATVTTSRTTHTGIVPSATDFTIRDPNPGPSYEKTNQGKFKIKFYDQNEPSGGYNITINWTSMDDTAASHTETVAADAGDYAIEINTLSNGVKHNSNITIKFNQNTYYNGQFYQANSVLKQFTYLANGPFSASLTPSSGDALNNTITVTVLIEDDNPYPDGSRVVSYEKTDGTKTNVTLNSTNSWEFTTTFVASIGTAKIYDTDKDNATNDNIIAQATYAVIPIYTEGGGKRRYPIVSTNLFDRQRSDYAIGKTHKDFSNTLF